MTTSDTGLSRGGNRPINRALHTMATVQVHNATDGRAYHDRKKATGKSSIELSGEATTAKNALLDGHTRRS